MRKRWGVFSVNARTGSERSRDAFRRASVHETQAPPDSGDMLLRVTNFVMPNACAVGGFEGNLGDGGLTMLWDVPIDDEHHWRYEFIFHRSGNLDTATLEAQYESEKLSGDRMRRTEDNRYLQDRSAMETGESYIGLGECFSVHDVFITQSQGVVHDQSREFLGSSDVAIIKARRQLAAAAREVAEGRDPPRRHQSPMPTTTFATDCDHRGRSERHRSRSLLREHRTRRLAVSHRAARGTRVTAAAPDRTPEISAPANEFVVHAIIPEARDVRIFDLRAAGGSLAQFEPGAHIDVELPNGMVRQYSLINEDRVRDRYLICVKHDPHSRGGSRFMHEQLRAGDIVNVRGIRNNFRLVPDAPATLLLAGGIGVTPIVAMAEHLANPGATGGGRLCGKITGRSRAARPARKDGGAAAGSRRR